VVDVAGEDEDGRRWGAALSGDYGPDRADHLAEGGVEGGPVVQVLGAAQVLGPLRGASSPGAGAEFFVLGLEVMHPRLEHQG